jgi:hypothetical protein
MKTLPKLDDILIEKDGNERKVLQSCGHVVILSDEKDFTKSYSFYTLEELNERGFTLKVPEEKWKPEIGKKYWFIGSDFTPHALIWSNDLADNARLNSPIGICPTKEAMQERIDWAIEKLKS